MKTKRFFAVVLVIAMLVTILPAAVFAKNAEEFTVPLEDEAIAKLSEGDRIHFGATGIEVDEGDVIYNVPVFRKGNTEGETTVFIKSVDVSAVYGKDYEFEMDDVMDESDGKSLVQKNAEAVNEAKEKLKEMKESGEDLTVDPEKEKEIVENTPMDDETKESLIADIESAMDGSMAEQIDFSAATYLTFAPGETEKFVKLRINDDSKKEGDEAFFLFFDKVEGFATDEMNNFGVTIKDNEPKEKSSVSFTEKKYKSKDGKVEVTIERSGAEYSLCNVMLMTAKDTAVPEKDYKEVMETVVFQPYDTEETFEIPVWGEGEFDIILKEPYGCLEGDCTEARVVIDEDKKDADTELSDEDVQLSDDSGSFGLTIGKKAYSIEYEGDDPQTGKIMDKGYNPKLWVGTYVFPTDRNFTYNNSNYAGGANYHTNEYRNTTADIGQRYGFNQWYHWVTGKKGNSWSNTKGKFSLNPLFYQWVRPDWQSESDFGGGQHQRFVIYDKNWNNLGGVNIRNGKFARKVDNSAEIAYNRNWWDKNFYLEFQSVDNDKNKTPKSYTRLYGIAAMFKRFRTDVGTYSKMKYLTPSGNIENYPCKVEMNTGARADSSGDYTHFVCTSTDEVKNNFVFEVTPTTLKTNVDGIFAIIDSYDIIINPADGKDFRKTLSYPNDFINYLDNTIKNHGTETLSGDSSKIESEKKKVLGNLNAIPYDSYVIDWLEREGIRYAVYEDGIQEGRITFVPKFKPYDVTVEVWDPSTDIDGSKLSGRFNSAHIGNGSQRTYKFKAGDEIDLTVAPGEEEQALGYEVSTDGGVHFDKITSTTSLLLYKNAKDDKYIVRPYLTKDTNRIEIQYENGAENYVQVQNLISRDLCEKDPLLAGKNILWTNMKETINPRAMSIPQPGKNYNVVIKVINQPEDGYEYRPYVRTSDGVTYNAAMVPYLARQEYKNNVLTVGVEKVKKSDLKRYTIKGYIKTKNRPVVDTGTAYSETPVIGYEVASGTEQNEDVIVSTKTSVAQDDGSFELTDVLAKSGDKIPLLVSNFTTDEQIVSVVTGESDTVNANTLLISYPSTAPSVAGITYFYGEAYHDNEVRNRASNAVQVFDDDITFQINANPNGKQIEKAVMLIYDADGNLTGSYDALPGSKDNPNIYSVTIKNMTRKLFSGDRAYVYFVDKENMHEGTTEKITYPTIDTGYTFFVENIPIVPQRVEITDEEFTELNIPIVGSVGASATSGLISFDRVNWDDEVNGFTYMINIGLGYDSTTGGLKLAKYQNFKNTVKAENGKDNPSASASDIMNNNNHPEDGKGNNDVQGQMDKSAQNKKDSNPESARPFANFEKVKWSLSATIMLGLDYVKVDGDYMYCGGAITFGVTGTISKTYYKLIAGIPMYINFGATVQLNYTHLYDTQEGRNALDDGTFSKYSGNIRTVLDSNSDHNRNNVVLVASGPFIPGIGIEGVLSVGGKIELTFQFGINDIGGDKQETGTLLTVGGAIVADLLITKINFNIARYRQGFGIYSDQSNFSFLGGTFDEEGRLLSEDDMEGWTSASDGKVVRRVSDYETITAQDINLGSDDFVGIELEGEEEAKEDSGMKFKALLQNAAANARPKIVTDDNGYRFITFVGKRKGDDSPNASAVYYAVDKNDGEGWSTPEMINDSSRYQTLPEIKVCNGKVALFYLEASKEFDELDNEIDKLKSMRPYVTLYDFESDEFDESTEIIKGHEYIDGDYVPFRINVNYLDGKLYLSTVNIDLTDIETLDELTSSNVNLFTASGVVDAETKEFAFWGKNKMVPEDMQDGCVMEQKDIITEINGKNYLVSALMVCEDCDKLNGDKGVAYFSLYDIENDVYFAPVALTKEGEGAAGLQLTSVNGDAIITYIKNGYEMNALNISKVLSEMFANDRDIVYEASADSSDWYKKTAEELGMEHAPEEGEDIDATKEYYESSVCYKVANDDWGVEATSLNPDSEQQINIGYYTTVAKDNRLYILYNGLGKNKYGASTGATQLFGLYYERPTVISDPEVEEEDEKKVFGFSEPVQITNMKEKIDEFVAYISDDGILHGLCSVYEERINHDGTLYTSPNTLSEVVYAIKNNMRVVRQPWVKFISPTKAIVKLKARNDGLERNEGFEVSIVDPMTGEIVATKEYDLKLLPNEETDVDFEWEHDYSIIGKEYKVIVKDKGAAGTDDNLGEAFFEVSDEQKLVATYAQITKGQDGVLVVEGDVTNAGGVPAEASTLKIFNTGNHLNKEKLMTEVDIPALQPGEVYHYVTELYPDKTDYDTFGMINIKCQTETDEDGESEAAAFIAAGKSVGVELNDGDEYVKVRKGGKTTLKSEAYPLGKYAGEAVFSSSDNSVATVDQKGELKGINEGTAEIEVYYPKYAIRDYITAIVSSGGSSGGGGGGSSLAEYAITVNDSENGTVTADKKTAAAGATVTLTAIPNEGASLEVIAVCDPDGNEIELTSLGDGKYSFKMPKCKVTVNAIFVGGKSESGFFTDVKESDWFYKAVKYAFEKNLMNGTSDKTFEPLSNVTRGMFATVLWRLDGCNQVDLIMPFTDVPENEYYTEAVRWAAAEEIVNGTTETTYEPEKAINREEMATMLYRYIQYNGGGFTGAWAFPLDFKDADQVSDWAYEPMCYLTMPSVGLIQGMEDGSLAPKNNTNRAELATILMRFLEEK